jgi:sugar-specific transcriptional regulator TrmB
MKKDVLKNLRDLGLSEREACVYLCLVEKTETTPYVVATELSLPRTTVYQTLEKLRRQGLVLASRKNRTRYYSPESFARLKELVETKQKALQLALPRLQALADASRLHEPTSHVYLGLEATKAVWEDMLEVYRKQKVALAYGTGSVEIYRLYGAYFSEWVERRWKLRMKTLLIFPESQRSALPFERHPDREDIRFLPDEFLYSGEITVYGSKTAVFSFDGERTYAIVIDSPEIAEIFTRTFRLMWQAAKE